MALYDRDDVVEPARPPTFLPRIGTTFFSLFDPTPHEELLDK